ncbi:hypothetical protein GWI33_012553 [Rhynchophorus ferrugineus]|uniref:Uncharacterized protein n=1 Tax=Rhynchophorus ferrugineus TaxID=354439 RepID=A0A834ME32_RHYFE|nr:hypothetical protein GWI33_012553 [Rhynchophorus ferrugineus]
MSKSERTAMGEYWAKTIEKEDALRAKWFKINEKRLNEIANKIQSRVVPEEIKESMKQNRIAAFQNLKKFPRIKTEDQVPEFAGKLQGIMKPIDPAIKKLIYTAITGRQVVQVFKEILRSVFRFYFPEVSSFEYGWRMWDYVKTIKKTGFGRQQIVKDTFYRRRGVEEDPEWYREPAQISPTFCNNCSMNRHVIKLAAELTDAREKLARGEESSESESECEEKKKQEDSEIPSEEIDERMEEKLEAAEADQKNLFLIIFQRFIMILSEHLVRYDTDGRDYNTHWYKWTIEIFQQFVFLQG